MHKYTIQYAVPATVKTGPDSVKWIKGVVDSGSYAELEQHAMKELASDKNVFYGRWKPSDGIVEVLRVYSDKASAAKSLKETKELYKSQLAKPVFSSVKAATDADIAVVLPKMI